MKPILLYGATGFSGSRIAKRLVGAGVDVILSGRNPSKLKKIGEQLGMPWQPLSLSNSSQLADLFSQCSLVFNMAGPYRQTAEPVIDAALHSRVHYLDLAGEWPVFQKAIALDRKAKQANSMLMPGVGFTIAVSDCLLVMAAERFADTKSLRLAISSPDLVSSGTLKSMLGLVDPNVWVCHQGEMKEIPVGSLNHYFPFGPRYAKATAVNWPDVFTAHHSTGISTIEAFAEVSLVSELLYQASSKLAPLLQLPPIQSGLQVLSQFTPTARKGSDASAGFILTVEAIDRWRRSSYLSLRTRDGYTVTTDIACKIIELTMQGHVKSGFQTPAMVFGADLIKDIPSIEPQG
jgi:saccharopine dehydrogenase (NAD+, L-lysine-forming)